MGREIVEKLVVIVDDEPALREAAESLFRSCGFDTESFASAEEFLCSGRGKRAACVVLDVRLPGMTGLQMQRELLAEDLLIPIVFMTAQFDADGRLQAQAMKAGARAFLRKPLGSHDLLTAVRACVEPIH
jgi:FixJ family two-component response regulator